ncbi:uncharacterized protein N7525_001826, partial [Penicillium rubens]|uniref:uncharacterized protein n=1 Tax=Penicillium rubens TaxID=1108849 RepID=UPI002A5A3051
GVGRSSAYGDILIGADGIRSVRDITLVIAFLLIRVQSVRRSFIPDHKLRFSGEVFIRRMFDASLVEGKIPDPGKDQYTTVEAYDDPRSAEKVEKCILRDKFGSVEFLEGHTSAQDWNPTFKALTELTLSTNLYPSFVGDALLNWVFGSRVTLVGDAAHAHGGAFAAGGSLALDDSLALGLAFEEVFSSSKATFSPENINKALGLYSQIRQLHTAGVTRKVLFLQHTKKRLHLLLETGRPNTEWLSEHDVEAAFTAVVEQLEGAQRQVRLAGPETERDGEIQLQRSKL